MLKPEEIAEAINTAKDSIDRSSFGPVFIYRDNNPINQDPENKVLNQTAFVLMQLVVPLLIRKRLESDD